MSKAYAAEIGPAAGVIQRTSASLRARIERGEQPGALQAEADLAFQGWASAMHARGIEVKGLWLIDFDNGSGYYCWVWPETKLEHYHSYTDGFSGRMRIH